MVNDDRAPCGQWHLASVRGLDLMLDLKAREQGNVVLVELHPVHVGRHDMAHELLRLLINRFGIDQDFADIRVEVVAYRADDQARFLVNQESAGLALRGAVDCLPELEQVVQVPLQLFKRAADARGTSDHAHPIRDLELADRVAQLIALFALDPARYAAATGVVRHQDQIPAGERNVSCKRSAFVTALVLIDLDDQLATFLELVLNAAAAAFAIAQIVAGYFLERQETVPIGTVVDEACFKAGLDAGDNRFVDVALALFLAGGLDVKVNQFLTIDDRHPEFFRLSGVEQHTFHGRTPSNQSSAGLWRMKRAAPTRRA